MLERARAIMRAEGESLLGAAAALDDRFLAVAQTILGLRGKVVLTGVGKSGIIAMKIAATLSSTGTPALFLHSVDAVMGDLGILSKDDLLIAISNSGETNEVINVVVAASHVGVPAVAMTNNPESTLARECRHVLPLHVDREACPLGLAPTTSTTVTLAIGDALAMVLMEKRGFSKEQFAAYHPGGNLGRRLALKVAGIMRTGDKMPLVGLDVLVSDAVREISAKGLGVTLVRNAAGQLAGILTDGDLRRLLEKDRSGTGAFFHEPVSRFVRGLPRTVEADAAASEALRIMEANSITSLAIVDPAGRPAGIIHLHDILGRGKLIL